MQNVVYIYDNNLHITDIITWRRLQKSILLTLKDANGNPVAKTNVPATDLKTFILNNNTMKKKEN